MFFLLLPKRGKHLVRHFTAAVTHYQRRGHTNTPAVAALAARLALLHHWNLLILNPWSHTFFLCIAADKQQGKGLKKRFVFHLCKVTNTDKLNWGTGIQEIKLELAELCCRLHGGIEKEEDKLSASTSVELRNQP